MFVCFESSIAGRTFSYAPGDVAEWPDETEAQQMVERGIAIELADRNAALEKAKISGRPLRTHRPPIEKAVKR